MNEVEEFSNNDVQQVRSLHVSDYHGAGLDPNYASDDSELGNFNPNRNAHKRDNSDSNVKANDLSSSWSQSMMNNSEVLQQHRQQNAKLELINT